MTEKRATNANSSDDNANVDSPKPEEEVVRILNTPVKPFLVRLPNNTCRLIFG